MRSISDRCPKINHVNQFNSHSPSPSICIFALPTNSSLIDRALARPVVVVDGIELIFQMELNQIDFEMTAGVSTLWPNQRINFLNFLTHL